MTEPVLPSKKLIATAQSLLRVLPRHRHVDRFAGFLAFVFVHRRLPSRRMIFNDVLYRLKTTTEILDPLRVFVSDKELLKVYVRAIVGDAFNVPTLAILRSAEEVERYEFPATCCVKPTHASGFVIMRRSGESVDREEIKKWLSVNYYDLAREENYRFLKPKIIVEPLLFDGDPMDYKIFCYNGAPRTIFVDIDRYGDHRRNFFDVNWKPLPFSNKYPPSERHIDRPTNLDRMLEAAAKLSAGFSFVRIDLYSDGETCLVGEITNCHGGACSPFIPPDAEAEASRIVFE